MSSAMRTCKTLLGYVYTVTEQKYVNSIACNYGQMAVICLFLYPASTFLFWGTKPLKDLYSFF